MYLLLDNQDSFVYNLAAYLRELGAQVEVVDARFFDIGYVASLPLTGVVISPGPGHPSDAHAAHELLDGIDPDVPVLGICLGHQVIAQHFGANIVKGRRPMHGKLSSVTHNGCGIFEGIPQGLTVTRYHSLVVADNGLPASLVVSARSDDGVIMGLEGTYRPLYSTQFHPEAVLSRYGHRILSNFMGICQERVCRHAS